MHPAAITTVLLLAAACTRPDTPRDDPLLLHQLFPFLVEGMTTRAAVLLELGLPMERFEHDRILAYRVLADRDRAPGQGVSRFVGPTWSSSPFHGGLVETPDPRLRVEGPDTASLILVFDDEGRLQRARLLQQG